nr:hypothetical protein [Tanacetum cinerariifolium]
MHKREYDSRVNERQIQTTEEVVDTSKALDASLVNTESNETESGKQNANSSSGNDADADDADIKPVYHEKPMVETKERNTFTARKAMLTMPVEYSATLELDKYKKALRVHDDVKYIMGLKSIPDRRRPGRRSHVNMTRNWIVYGTMCDFELPKMLRFKRVDKVE